MTPEKKLKPKKKKSGSFFVGQSEIPLQIYNKKKMKMEAFID